MVRANPILLVYSFTNSYIHQSTIQNVLTHENDNKDRKSSETRL